MLYSVGEPHQEYRLWAAGEMSQAMPTAMMIPSNFAGRTMSEVCCTSCAGAVPIESGGMCLLTGCNMNGDCNAASGNCNCYIGFEPPTCTPPVITFCCLHPTPVAHGTWSARCAFILPPLKHTTS